MNLFQILFGITNKTDNDGSPTSLSVGSNEPQSNKKDNVAHSNTNDQNKDRSLNSIILFLVMRRMRQPLLVLFTVYSIAGIGMTLIPDINQERMSFFHAFYFVSYMGTTIGFGEIPHEFTDAQRMWVTISLYMTVIAWIYAIGRLINLLQDEALQKAFTENSFAKNVKKIKEPFYIICGYGDTGTALVSALEERSIRTIVIELNQERLNDLILDYSVHIPALCDDASKPENLQVGLDNPKCKGVVAVTNDNIANLHIAITSKLLKPKLTVIGRVDSKKISDNMLAFVDTDYVIDHFNIFAKKLHYALHAPTLFKLRECLTRQKCFSSCSRVEPPKEGLWIVCSFGRLGKAVYKEFQEEKNIHIIVLEPNIKETGPPEGKYINGRGTDKDTLKKAEIEDAVGIVIGTNDDVTNLSIMMLARELNKDIFVVIRQNSSANQIIFDAAKADLVMHASNIIANHIRVLLTNPLLQDFINLSKSCDNEWVLKLMTDLKKRLGDDAIPITWQMSINNKETPALLKVIKQGKNIKLKYLRQDPKDREHQLAAVPLLLIRDNNPILLPKDDEILQEKDQILWCSKKGVATWMKWSSRDDLVLSYIVTGYMPPRTYIGRWLEQKFDYGSK